MNQSIFKIIERVIKYILYITEAISQRCSVKKYSEKFRKIIKKTLVPVFSKFINKGTLAEVLCCEFCEIF